MKVRNFRMFVSWIFRSDFEGGGQPWGGNAPIAGCGPQHPHAGGRVGHFPSLSILEERANLLGSAALKRTRKNLETRAGAPAAVAKADPAPAAVQPAAHRWVFRLMALVLPVLGLCAVEVFLRMAGYGYPPAFFLRGKVNGRESWINPL